MQESLNSQITRKKKKWDKVTVLAASVAVLWLIFELIVYLVALPDAPGIVYSNSEWGEGGYQVIEGSTLVLDDVSGDVDVLSLKVMLTDAQKDNIVLRKLPRITVKGFDPAASREVTYKVHKLSVGHDEPMKNVITLDIPEGTKNLTVILSHEGYDYSISDIRTNAGSDISFNFGRCAIVFVIILLLYACSHFGLWKVFFDGEKHGLHALAFCLVCVILAMLMTAALNPNREPIEYPYETKGELESANQYIQQFDAMLKGQLHLDCEPSEDFLALENPYDYDERSGTRYLWDRAFYDGKYYSYFGVAPIFTVYYPYYYMTGDIPADDTVSAVFTVMTVLFLSMAAMKWAAMFTKKVPLPLVFAGTVGALISTQVFLIARGYARVYYIATVAGMAFLTMFIWLFLCGVSGGFRLRSISREPKPWYKPIIFTLAGVAYGLCFLSRFNIALVAAFVILPALLFLVVTARDGDGKRRLRPINRMLPELACLALPVVLAMGYQFWLNLARFDSILEFGTNYQLTVSDVSKNKLRISDLPATIFHYFLQPILPSIDPPIMSLYYVTLNNYGHYVYIDTGMGLFAIPFMWGLFGSISVFAGKRYKWDAKLTAAALLVGLVTVALFDFCMGGVIFRYTCDLTLIAAFASMGLIFAFYEDIASHCSDTACARVNVVATVFIAVSIFVSFSLALSDNANLTAYAPEVCGFFRSLVGA